MINRRQKFSVCGIDPGATGAAAVIVQNTFGHSGSIYVFPFAEFKGDWKGADSLKARAAMVPPVYMERVHSMPSDSGKAAFSFGYQVGCVIGVLLEKGIKPVEVAPKEWQRELGLDNMYAEQYLLKQPKNDVAKKTIRKQTNLAYVTDFLTNKANLIICGKLNVSTADAACIAVYGWKKELEKRRGV